MYDVSIHNRHAIHHSRNTNLLHASMLDPHGSELAHVMRKLCPALVGVVEAR